MAPLIAIVKTSHTVYGRSKVQFQIQEGRSGKMQQKTNRIGIVMPLAHQQGGAEALFLHLLRQYSKLYTLQCVFLQEGPLVEQVRGWGYETLVIRTTRLTDPFNYL